jgi:hypothetical protein
MRKGKGKVMLASSFVLVLAIYLIAPYFILGPVIKNARSDVSGTQSMLRTFYYFAYAPLLRALPSDFWYTRIIAKRAHELCKDYPDSCARPDDNQ